MKTIATKTALALIVLVLAAFPAFGAEQTVQGVVSDSMCGRKHMIPGKTDAECTRQCIKAKSKYALVTADKVYTLQAPPAELDKLAGKHVQVTGEVEGTSLKVIKITAAK
ncbi:MAG: hypothetical protein ROO76_15335 [Terriglobia bacterium]|jgi:hypothetical protein|nr:hypothetical protein [Terriglobia bacterium]